MGTCTRHPATPPKELLQTNGADLSIPVRKVTVNALVFQLGNANLYTLKILKCLHQRTQDPLPRKHSVVSLAIQEACKYSRDTYWVSFCIIIPLFARQRIQLRQKENQCMDTFPSMLPQFLQQNTPRDGCIFKPQKTFTGPHSPAHPEAQASPKTSATCIGSASSALAVLVA